MRQNSHYVASTSNTIITTFSYNLLLSIYNWLKKLELLVLYFVYSLPPIKPEEQNII